MTLTSKLENTVKKWLQKEKYRPCNYVGGTDNLQDVCLDGWFNLEELANITQHDIESICRLLRDRIDYEEANEHEVFTNEQHKYFINGMKYALDIIQNPDKY